MEPWWNNTSVFLGDDQQFFPEPLRAHGNSEKGCMGLRKDFKKKMQQTGRHSHRLIQVELPVNSLLKHRSYNKCGYESAPTRKKEEDLTTTLSPSSLRPVSFKWETINGHTPMMLATKSTRWGIIKSLYRMAFFRAGRETTNRVSQSLLADWRSIQSWRARPN